jgi:uncharacterized protein YqhQ
MAILIQQRTTGNLTLLVVYLVLAALIVLFLFMGKIWLAIIGGIVLVGIASVSGVYYKVKHTTQDIKDTTTGIRSDLSGDFFNVIRSKA